MDTDFQIKLRKFKNDKRAFYSFLFLLTAFLLALPAELTCNVRPLLLVVDGKPHFPIFVTYSEKDFGGTLPSEPDYKSKRFMRLLSGEAEPYADSTELDLGDFEEEAGFTLDLDDFEEDEEDQEKV